ncbi:YbaY family lipoprotein [Pseudogulbenkiania sp. MAI-1]|uniref:YbaY family lipoprotein n=1 Tax=Pseudogulbenkiania sp. MAI-1 TaxID=990370 RepID=UPI00045E665E|nr:YbaY family lipoprotein [Pseudogulbenkiania sp. MAI-1]
MDRRHALLGLAALALSACATRGGYTPAYLNGTVSLAADSPLSRAGSLVRVSLLDVSNSDAPPRLLAEQYLEQPPAFPAGFSLCYDRHAIQADGRYVVEAKVFVDGELRLASREPRRVLDGSSNADIRVEPVAR